jgi:phage N-6-adenine-methyltransferase
MSGLALPDLAAQDEEATGTDGTLILYGAACRALAAAKTTDEVKDIRDRAEAMRAYARQAKNRQLEVDAAEIRIRAERRLGELIRAQKETVGLNVGGRPITGADGELVIADTRPTLADAGIDKKLSSRAQKLAAVPEAKFEGLVAEWRDRVERENERVTAALLGGRQAHPPGPGSVEWYTPASYLDCARRVLGEFDLDPASSAVAQEQVQARAYFTKEGDGLTQPWQGKVWCNPPYCDAGKFVDKLLTELSAGRTTEAVLLVNAYCDTRWFHRAAAACAAICFLLGRIYFERPDGDQLRQPAYGSAFIYFGHQVDRFRAAFAERGVIMLPARAAP